MNVIVTLPLKYTHTNTFLFSQFHAYIAFMIHANPHTNPVSMYEMVHAYIPISWRLFASIFHGYGLGSFLFPSPIFFFVSSSLSSMFVYGFLAAIACIENHFQCIYIIIYTTDNPPKHKSFKSQHRELFPRQQP